LLNKRISYFGQKGILEWGQVFSGSIILRIKVKGTITFPQKIGKTSNVEDYSL